MKFYILLVILFFEFCAADVFNDLVHEEWNSYKIRYDKTYRGSIEETYRFKIFITNLKMIHMHNQRYQFGEESFEMGVNQFTDMFSYEVEKIMCGINGSVISAQIQNTQNEMVTFLTPENIQVADEVNWVTKGAVTEVKNQGHCGSCWAFSSTGSLEGQNFRLTKKLISLSEQNLMDCSRNYGNQGCQGGLMDRAFKYIRDNRGIDTEQNYPYEGVDNYQCRYKRAWRGASCKGYTMIPQFDEQALKIAVATVGPISVAIEVSSKFYLYESGVFYDPTCHSSSADAINHGVLIVGYGTDQTTGQDYWLVKNSWGKSWGMEGYIKMARNKNNNCNIATYALFPLI